MRAARGALLASLAVLSSLRAADEPPPGADRIAPGDGERPDGASPWAFGLGLYTWLPAVDAKLASGNLETTIDESLFDIIDATKGVPLSIGGRLDMFWRRFGLFADLNYFNLRFREQDIAVGNVATGSASVDLQMGFLEYAAAFRVLGTPEGERANRTAGGPPRLDLYAGARTVWLDVEIEPETLPGSSGDEVFTSPLLGGRLEIDIGPRWFVRIDGNVGGFDVDDVELAAEGLAAFGFRPTTVGLRTEIWLGYQALYFEAEEGGALDRLESDTLLHGPALGLAFSW